MTDDVADGFLRASVLALPGQPAIHWAAREDLIPVEDLAKRGIRVLRVDARAVHSHQTLWKCFRAGDLSFLGPGGSWAAFMEILGYDLEDFVPGDGHVLIIRNAASFIRANPALALNLIQVWGLIFEGRDREVPLHLVFVLDDVDATSH